MIKKRKNSNNISLQEKILVVSILGFFLVLLFRNASLPFVGYNSWNFNTYSLIARNYVQFGLVQTKFAPVISVSEELPAEPEYYLKHPPFLSILQAGSFVMFGESYFTARLPALFAALLSLIVLSLLAKRLFGKRAAIFTLIVGSLIPGSSIFGKMIGQESLLLCFALFAFYSLTLYQETNKGRFLVLALLSVIFATLTDWPGFYLGVLLGVSLFLRKQQSVGVLVGFAGILPAILYALYIWWVTGSFDVLTGGFLVRSLGDLLRRDNWFLLWSGTIVIRLVVYFNILFAMLAGIFVFANRRSLFRYPNVTVFFLFLFGLIHVTLYPEGSFGHPYWMYYLYPAIAIGSAAVLSRLWEEKRVFVVAVFTLAFAQTLFVTNWKEKEIEGNLFRYELAAVVAQHIPPYETIALREGGLIDPDILAYSFSIPTNKISGETLDEKSYQYVLFSCFQSCESDTLLARLATRHPTTTFIGKNLSMHIVMLESNEATHQTIEIPLSSPVARDSLLRGIYIHVLSKIGTPQL